MATTVTARQLPRQLPRRPVFQISGLVIASIAVAVVAVAVSTRPPAASNLTPGEVIDAFVSARQMGDVDAATRLFQSDTGFTDSAGNTSRGRDAATSLIGRYRGFEAGPRQVTGDEVV